MRERAVWFALALLIGCGGGAKAPSAPSSAQHGRLSELSRVEGEIVLCDHRVPEQVCAKHHPDLVPSFKRVGDWCKEHDRPESQCLECHPDLTFEPLPKLSEQADIAWLADHGEDVPRLAPHAVKGKVTVFELYADWCAVCRKVDGYMFKRLASGDSLAYRKLNVVDWDTPLGQRYLKDVPTLPLVVVFGKSGNAFRTLYGADLALMEKTIDEAQSR